MAAIEELREKIDAVDDEIVRLFEQRMRLGAEIGEYKIRDGLKVVDRQREKNKLQDVVNKVSTDFNKKGIRELFEQLMAMNRKQQYQQLVKAGALGRLPFIEAGELDAKNSRIVFPGTEGAYSQAAMQYYFGERCNSFYVRTFRDAMEAIEEGAADYAVLPIENSTAGAVDEMYDLLVEFENYIVGEQIIKIEHCLLGLPGTDLEQIRTVYSHPQSLMQSARYLNAHENWQQVSMQNNAFAARKVSGDMDRSQAAIASEQAAKIYGLDILERGVNQSDTNSTRFIIVTNQKVFLKNAGKISLCLEVPHESGSLYRILSHFIYNGLNMTKIESRPIEGRNWEYRFFIDFEGNLGESAVKNALRGLREEARNMKVLGNY